MCCLRATSRLPTSRRRTSRDRRREPTPHRPHDPSCSTMSSAVAGAPLLAHPLFKRHPEPPVPTAPGAEDLPRHRARGMREDRDHRADPLRLQVRRRRLVLHQIRARIGVVRRGLHHRRVHPGAQRAGRQQVRLDPDVLALEGERAGEAQQPGLGRAVVRLRPGSDHPGAGGHRDEPAAAVGLHHLERRVEHPHDTAQVDVDHVVEVLHRHLVEGHVPQDRRVRHHRIQPTPLIHRLLGEARRTLDRGHGLGVRHRLAAGFADLRDDLLGQPRITATTEGMATEVVHDHPGAPLGQLERMTTAHPATGAGHNDDVALEAQSAHARTLRRRWH